MEKIEFHNRNEVEKIYTDFIYAKGLHGNTKKSIDDLKELRKEYHCGQFQYHFVTLLIRNFKRVLVMSPKEMEIWIKRIDPCFGKCFYEVNNKGEYVKQTPFGEKLVQSLGYERLQNKILKKFFHETNNFKTCYYCNSQYTLTFVKEELESVKFQIDHIFPKKKYPYFSISLYNLIPSCANCNLNKGDGDFWTKDYFHPYLDSVGDYFKFTLGKKSDGTILLKGASIDHSDLQIDITGTGNIKVKNHNELFDITGIYGNFTEIASEIIELGREYPESKRKELLKHYKDSKDRPLFQDQESIDRVFLRVYPNKKDINKRPLSKFIQDISRFSDFYD